MNIKIRKPQFFSEIGRKDNQEDYLWPLPQTVKDSNRIFLLCDGVGGHEKGEVAARIAAIALGTYLTKCLSENEVVTQTMFEEALSYGYDELDKESNGSTSNMGTTMTCLVLHRGGALVAHIGDSRIYHIRPSLAVESGHTGIIYQSADHSLVNELLRVGEITEEEAANFPRKNIITRAMQPRQERRDKADVYNIVDIQRGDYFFLCSDGVLEKLNNEKLGSILADMSSDDEGKIKAIRENCDNQTRDNYTCWLIPIDNVEKESIDGGIRDEDVVATVVYEDDIENNNEVEEANVSCRWSFGTIAKSILQRINKEKNIVLDFKKGYKGR